MPGRVDLEEFRRKRGTRVGRSAEHKAHALHFSLENVARKNDLPDGLEWELGVDDESATLAIRVADPAAKGEVAGILASILKKNSFPSSLENGIDRDRRRGDLHWVRWDFEDDGDYEYMGESPRITRFKDF